MSITSGSPYAKPQPKAGHFWMHLEQIEHGQLPIVRVEYRAIMCQHCEKCPLVNIGAAYRREDGLVILDPAKATNKNFLNACPYGVVYWNEELGVAQKCTGRAHLVDQGKQPHCVDFCGTNALRYVDMEEAANEIISAETLNPEAGYQPHAFYLNLPHLFLAGEIWNKEYGEDIIGAKVALLKDGEEVANQLTDDFGDFKFEHLDEGIYNIRVEYEGAHPLEITSINLDKSRYIGDYVMTFL